MTSYVLDASAVAAWFLPGQRTTSADLLSSAASRHRFFVPHLFPIEVRNLFLVGERRGRLTADMTAAALSDLDLLDLTVVPAGSRDDWNAVLTLARTEDLTAYDALYLHLAITQNLDLATRDTELIEAAIRRNIIVFDLRT